MRPATPIPRRKLIPPLPLYRHGDCTTSRPRQAPHQLESVRWLGGKNVGATSDYPHWDSSGIDTLQRYIEEFPDFTEVERHDFLQSNLCDLFGVTVAEG